MGDTRPAAEWVRRAWLAYMRAQLRGDTSVLPPVDVTRHQMALEPDPDPEF